MYFTEVLKLYKKNPANVEIDKVWLRSDGAGCYKSSSMILAEYEMRKSIKGITIMGHIFSAAAGGKYKCKFIHTTHIYMCFRTQFWTFSIFLSLRFYVKSILEKVKLQKFHFCNFMGSEFLIWVNFSLQKMQKFMKYQNS